MASLLLKRFASNLSRVKTIASSSRFFSTKGYEFVQHDTKDECILKCEDNIGSSAARCVIDDAFSPHVSAAENLARLFNVSDFTIRYVHGTHIFPRWAVVEDDKALYILRDNTAEDIGDVRKSVKEFMTGDHEENFNEGVSISEEGHISGNVKENFNEAVPISEEEHISGKVKEKFNEAVPSSEEGHISGNIKENFNETGPISEEGYLSGNVKEKFDPKRNVFPIINIIRGDEYVPTGEYYYHVMKDDKEVKQFVESLDGTPAAVNGNIHASIKMYAVANKPQAVYILVVLGDPETRNPYGGYVMEIFLDDSLYSVYDMKSDFTGFNMKLFIPKKKAEGTKTIGGKLIFYSEKKFMKPTPWRPT